MNNLQLNGFQFQISTDHNGSLTVVESASGKEFYTLSNIIVTNEELSDRECDSQFQFYQLYLRPEIMEDLLLEEGQMQKIDNLFQELFNH